ELDATFRLEGQHALFLPIPGAAGDARADPQVHIILSAGSVGAIEMLLHRVATCHPRAYNSADTLLIAKARSLSMSTKHLTEAEWRTIVKKHKITDKGLSNALTKYGKFDEDEFDERLEQLDEVVKEAKSLKGDNKKNTELVAYLDEVLEEAGSV